MQVETLTLLICHSKPVVIYLYPWASTKPRCTMLYISTQVDKYNGNCAVDTLVSRCKRGYYIGRFHRSKQLNEFLNYTYTLTSPLIHGHLMQRHGLEILGTSSVNCQVKYYKLLAPGGHCHWHSSPELEISHSIKSIR